MIQIFAEHLTLRPKVIKALPAAICYEINKDTVDSELNTEAHGGIYESRILWNTA